MLRSLGLHFRLLRPGFEELLPRTHRAPAQFARRAAVAKVLSVAGTVDSGWLLGVDTIVVAGNRVLGKPRSRDEARKMLRLLSGSTHRVISGIAVDRRPSGALISASETTFVTFRKLSTLEIRGYISTREPYDKAGAYGIQERAGVFVESVMGCYTNVVGMPVPLVLELLDLAGWTPARG